MWIYRARLGILLVHFLSLRTVLDIASEFEDGGCISLKNKLATENSKLFPSDHIAFWPLTVCNDVK
jgi:hypothetical protein